ncbi:helix-turn-helix domain-containing protein [Clostridium sp. DJ247]|uniref:helix-turn-helix domain-containing protein n=1 Tax=Clostridium sp. DJ247 TaxID=2726188 RepID=UPI0037C0CBFD
MHTRNVIGKRIKMLRLKEGITQEQLAARLNVQGIDIDRPMISKIENQSRELLDYEIIGIAKALGVPIEFLFKNK